VKLHPNPIPASLHRQASSCHTKRGKTRREYRERPFLRDGANLPTIAKYPAPIAQAVPFSIAFGHPSPRSMRERKNNCIHDD
jgi:hypothetical protein